MENLSPVWGWSGVRNTVTDRKRSFPQSWGWTLNRRAYERHYSVIPPSWGLVRRSVRFQRQPVPPFLGGINNKISLFIEEAMTEDHRNSVMFGHAGAALLFGAAFPFLFGGGGFVNRFGQVVYQNVEQGLRDGRGEAVHQRPP